MHLKKTGLAAFTPLEVWGSLYY